MINRATKKGAIDRNRLRRATVRWLIAAGSVLVLPAPVTIAQHGHTIIESGEVEWTPGPASIPEGAEAATLYGNPSEDGLFALRLKLPADYELPPHHHPQPEVVTVISGTFHLGMGEEADRVDTHALGAGAFFAFEPGMAHYAFTDEETVIQLNSTGPWGLEYVDPDDDPRQASQ